MAKYSDGLKDNLDLTNASIKVLEGRYLKKEYNEMREDDSGRLVETADDMLKRVAHNIAEADKNYDKNAEVEDLAKRFYDMMSNLYFLPNSPTLMNAGRELQQLSGCFVLPIDDTIESIFGSARDGALVHKSGGGTGYSFSRLRPKKDKVKSTSGVSSGPVSFMYAYNTYTDVIKQGGKRRGANMGILRVDHPDILEFIHEKSRPNEKNEEMIKRYFGESKILQEVVGKMLMEGYQLNNFNISVGITDKFMDALNKGEEYELINPKTKKAVKKVYAKEIFDKIVYNSWKTAEPGVVFLDRINKNNPTPEIGEIESTNPCGEQPLLPYESCNLGSINLSKFVKNRDIDWNNLEKVIDNSIHFLDNVIDMNKYPLEEISKMTKGNRKIGLGVMGWADMLIQLGIPYNSKKAIDKAGKVMSFIQNKSKEASEFLAGIRGSFPNIEKSIYHGIKMRNAATTTIAPTGTIGIIAGASSGIEPLFAVVYKRTTPQFLLYEPNPIFERIAKEKGFYSERLIEEIFEKGSIKEIEIIPEDIREIFVTAHDLTPEDHIRMQAEFQKYTDNAVSKTINFSKKATEEDVRKAYLLAYDLNCKGVTIYVDGSKDEQVLTTGKEKTKKKSLVSRIVEEAIDRERPEIVIGETLKQETPWGKMFLTVNHERDTGRIYEAFLTIGKGGEDVTAMAEGYGRTLSLLFKAEVPVERIIEQFEGIGGKSQILTKGKTIRSLPDAIAAALREHLNHVIKMNGEKTVEDKEIKQTGNLCPQCGSSLVRQEGCEKCSNPECDYNRCG